MRLRWLLIAVMFLIPLSAAGAQSTETPTPELSSMVTVVPPGSEASQDAVVVYEISDGDVINALLLFTVVMLLLLNLLWSLRRGNTKLLLALPLIALLLLASPALSARAQSSAWCGYALIEGIPQINNSVSILSLLTPDAGRNDILPDQLFQVKVSLDGSKAIIEGCWKVFPSRDVIVNLLTLTGSDEKAAVDELVTYSLFAPEGTREDSAASVRRYLSEHINEWELQDE